MPAFEVPEIDYSRYTDRQLAAVPLAVLAVALGVLLVWYFAVAPVGWPVDPGIDFTGGTELRVATETPRGEIPSAFDIEPESIQGVQGSASQYILTFHSPEDQALADQANANLQPLPENGDVVRSRQSTSATFGENAQRTAVLGVGIAFLGMSALAFLFFRTFVPSIAIVVSAFSDIVIPLALMDILGIELSLGTVAALLMLIGYSVDSDILLNDHILRRSGGFYESTYRAMRTGVTMTVTSLAAMAVMAVVAFYFGIDLLASIGLILVFGLSADLMNTYLLNLSLLRWYKYEGVAR